MHTNETTWLDQYDPSNFERPSVAVDVALLSVRDQQLKALFVTRTQHPHKGRLALPGTFVQLEETLEEAARRALTNKASGGVLTSSDARPFLEQLYTFGRPDRDPRTRVLSVAYFALAPSSLFDRYQEANPDSLALPLEVPWEGETGGEVNVLRDGLAAPMAFDHAEMLGMAIKRLRGRLAYSPIGFQLLSERFTLRELQTVHETVLGHPLNKDSFRRRMLASASLEATGEHQRGVGHRPAELYRFLRRAAV